MNFAEGWRADVTGGYWPLLPPPRRICNRRCLSVCLSVC